MEGKVGGAVHKDRWKAGGWHRKLKTKKETIYIKGLRKTAPVQRGH